MAQTINLSLNIDKKSRYQDLSVQIEALITHETNWIANLANVAAALKMEFDWHWIGFYLVNGDQLVLGPFQGPVACTRINFAQGVCGTAWQTKCSQVVPDVNLFAGHIACSSLSRSEIVIPIINPQDEVIAVLDIDSSVLNDFDSVDQLYLEQLVKILQQTKLSAELAIYCDVFP